MKLKQFIEEKTITGFEVIENQIAISIFIDKVPYALNNDTSQIIAGTPLTTVENFQINGDIITVAGIQINTNEIEILTPEEALTNMFKNKIEQ